MNKTIDRRIEKLADRLGVEHTKLLLLQDEIDDELNALSVAETIGVSGERLGLVLDNINIAEDRLAEAVYYLRKAKQFVK